MTLARRATDGHSAAEGAGAGGRRLRRPARNSSRPAGSGRRKVVREQGMRVDPAQAVIGWTAAGGDRDPAGVYLALNKPRGSSRRCPTRGAADAGRLPHRAAAGLFHVGRLDADSEGLHLSPTTASSRTGSPTPRTRSAKTYLVEVTGPLGPRRRRRLRAGSRARGRPGARRTRPGSSTRPVTGCCSRSCCTRAATQSSGG